MSNQNSTLNQAISSASPFLKGLAIIGIILHHYYRGLYGITQNVQWIYSQNFLETFLKSFFSGLSEAFIASFYYLGYMGVSIFFVLSGWGLAMSALKRGPEKFALSGYFKSRAQKIFPLFLASLFFFGLLFYGQGGKGLADELLGSLAKLLLLTNYSPSAIFTINPSYWFLGTIAILYILFPIIFLATLKSPKITLLTTISIAYLATIAIQLSPLQQWHPFFAMGGFPLAKIGEFSLGVFAAIIINEQKTDSASFFKDYKYTVIAILLLLLGLYSFSNPFAYPLHPILMVIPIIFFSIKTFRFANFWPKLLKPITYAGLYSYSAFLLHRPFVDAWVNINDQNSAPIFYGLLFLLASVVLPSLFEITCNKTTTPLLSSGIGKAFDHFSHKNHF
ncbi:acyltransferase [Candidatus Falkowbacteria bacterium]|nr:acyltransferase [Candidatus Falkowbacteria bacterium]